MGRDDRRPLDFAADDRRESRIFATWLVALVALYLVIIVLFIWWRP